MSQHALMLLKYLLVAIAVLYLLFGVVRPVLKEVMKPPKPPEPAAVEGEGAAGEGGGRLLAVAGDEEPILDENGEPVPPDDPRYRELKESRESRAPKDPQAELRKQYAEHLEAAREQVKTDPRMAAQIIKEWISADE